MKKPFKKTTVILVLSLTIFLVVTGVVYAATAATSVTVSWPINSYISISQPSNLNMPAVAGTGGTSEGTVAWTVGTNSLLGYSLTTAANTTPAMTGGGYNIPDYSPAVPNTPELWSITASQAAFGFSAEGASTPAGTWGTPSTPGSGKYRGFNGATGIQIASRILPVASEATTVYFKGEIGTSYMQPSGTYSASITTTASTL